MTGPKLVEFDAILRGELTYARVERCVELIRQVGADDGESDEECAHGMEDKLHQAVLQDIATQKWSGRSCADLAEIALRTRQIKFSRWCA